MVKIDRKTAILRANAIQKELANIDGDLDKRESLMKEYEMLKTTIDDGSKSKYKEIILKTGSTMVTAGFVYLLNRNGFLDKVAMQFIPKHI